MFENWCGPVKGCGLGNWSYDYQTLLAGFFALMGGGAVILAAVLQIAADESGKRRDLQREEADKRQTVGELAFRAINSIQMQLWFMILRIEHTLPRLAEADPARFFQIDMMPLIQYAASCAKAIDASAAPLTSHGLRMTYNLRRGFSNISSLCAAIATHGTGWPNYDQPQRIKAWRELWAYREGVLANLDLIRTTAATLLDVKIRLDDPIEDALAEINARPKLKIAR